MLTGFSCIAWLILIKSKIIGMYEHEPQQNVVFYDRVLLWRTLGLTCISLVMVTSSSMPMSTHIFHDQFYFFKREAFYVILSFALSLYMLRVPMTFWQRYSTLLLLINIAMLLVVLIVGSVVNGASRWLVFGPLHIQPSELSKLVLLLYLSDYLVRKIDEVRNYFWGFCKPMGVMVVLAVLLLAQPDLGTVIVLFVTTLAILFLAGAKIWQFLSIICIGILAVVLLIITEPYRMQRVMSFWNPWQDPFGSGYQLTQSLMAFGRGAYLGQGLGNSIQKLEYLPEAHTDFIFAIIGEELGLIGVYFTLYLIFSIAFRAMLIGHYALKINQNFSGFLAYSIGIWFSFQAIVNLGATVGILPIKGLTLPLISYGGSSFLIMLTAIVLLLRIDFENRMIKYQARLVI